REAEREALCRLATELEHDGHTSLAWLLRQPAQPGQSLIVVAVRYFFRREVEKDEVLARRLSFGQAEEMTRGQQEGFERLDAALDDLHVAPDIPPRKLAGGCRASQVPADETILVLFEATVTGTGRCSLLLGRVGLYYFNDHGTKVAGPGQIPYSSLIGRRIWRES